MFVSLSNKSKTGLPQGAAVSMIRASNSFPTCVCIAEIGYLHSEKVGCQWVYSYNMPTTVDSPGNFQSLHQDQVLQTKQFFVSVHPLWKQPALAQKILTRMNATRFLASKREQFNFSRVFRMTFNHF